MSNIISTIKKGFSTGWAAGSKENGNEGNSFEVVAKEIGYRLAKPLYFFPFWVYLLIVTLLTGLAGVFTTIHQELTNATYNHANITLSLATYFIALLASSSTDLILSNKDDKCDKEVRALGVGMILLGVGLFWASVIFPKYCLPHWVYYIPSFLGTSIAIFSWWLANAHNPNLINGIDPNNATPSGEDIVPPENPSSIPYQI